jgi:hypothetical protein
MTIIERERTLTDAARRYLAGEISYAQLTRIRRATDRPADRGTPAAVGEGT